MGSESGGSGGSGSFQILNSCKGGISSDDRFGSLVWNTDSKMEAVWQILAQGIGRKAWTGAQLSIPRKRPRFLWFPKQTS